MVDDGLLILCVAVLCLAIGGQAGYSMNKNAADKYEKAIEQCEAALPRNQHCVITAVPEQGDE